MKLKFANALSLALIMAMLFTSIGLADNIQDDIQTGNPTISFSAGSSATVKYWIQDTGSDGCGASDGTPVTVAINAPAGLTATPSSLIFTACGSISLNTKSVVYTSNSPGTYAITAGATDIDTNDSYNTNNARLTVVVTAPTNTAPTLSLPSNITTEATSGAGAAVSYTATASDTQDGSLTPNCSPASGSTFPLGPTTVNCSVTDSGGMSASGSFTVTVQDTTAPALTLPATITTEATSGSGAAVSYTATATDLVDGSVAISCSPASGATFPLGNNTVNCSASDSHGNNASGSFGVVVQDTTAPTLNLPANISQEASGPSGNVVTYSASATDAVDGAVTVTCAPASGSTFPIAATTVNCSATDSHSNMANGSFSVTIADTIAPMIAAHLDETAEATSAAGAIVNYTSPATSDAVDGAGTATCAPASGTQFALGNTTITCDASDAAGNDATSTTFVVHVVDTTDPIITFVDRTAANVNGWNNGDVTVNWSCTDLVGVASATVSETVSTEGENQSATGTCADTSGNTADDTQSGINIDTTAPSASAGRAPAANANGWNNSDVTVSFSGTDALSGIASCSADQVFGEGADQSASGTCTDKAGNDSAPASISDINVDKTVPTASASAAPGPNANGWNNSAVTVSFSGSDALSDIDFCDANIDLSSEGAGQVASGTCTDNAGNVSTPATKTVNIDLTAPSVALVGGPANGQTYYFGSVPATPTCSASDVLSGLDGSCSVSGYSSAVGSHTVSTSATDKAGNSASASASYNVLAWTLQGFYQPVDINGVVNTVKGGSTVPLKFEVFAGPTELTNTSIVSTLVKQVTCNATSEDTIEVLATGGTSLRYDAVGGQFIFNWQTPRLPGKCYSVTLMTQDGSSITALFKLK
jgi:hypothetical protein